MKSPTKSPSELIFGSLLVYAPQGTSETSILSQRVVRDIKNCRPGYIERIGLRFEQRFQEGLHRDLLGPTVLLVPAPRSTPSVKDMHWPALRICRELADRGLCQDVARLLERHTPMRKSATSESSNRPSPAEHAASLRCAEHSPEPDRITIVDDVVTRGATLMGCAWALAERFSGATLHGLAVIRTMSKQEVTTIFDPIDNGKIYMKNGAPKREP